LKIAALRAAQADAEAKLTGLNRSPDLTAGLFRPSKTLPRLGFFPWLDPASFPPPLEGQRAEADAAREISRISVEAVSRRIGARVSRRLRRIEVRRGTGQDFETRLLAEIEDELKISLEYYRYGKIEAYACWTSTGP